MLKIKDWLNIRINVQFKPILEGEMRKKHTIITAMRLSDDKKFTLGSIFFDSELKVHESETLFKSATILSFKEDLVNVEISCILTNSDFTIYYETKDMCEINEIESVASLITSRLVLKYIHEEFEKVNNVKN